MRMLIIIRFGLNLLIKIATNYFLQFTIGMYTNRDIIAETVGRFVTKVKAT